MKTYTTIRGDTWDYIALKELGSEMYTHLLLKANPDYISRFILFTNQN